MYLKIFFNVILILVVAILQISFVVNLPIFLSYLILPILVFIFLLVFFNLEMTLFWGIGFGIIFDIFYFSIFGLYLFVYFLTILVINFLLKNFFTNRSLYSMLALTIFAVLANFIFSLIFIFLSGFILQTQVMHFNLIFLYPLFKQLLVNIPAMILLFYLINYLSQGFKPVFLRHNKHL